jgi:hypothetical protein
MIEEYLAKEGDKSHRPHFRHILSVKQRREQCRVAHPNNPNIHCNREAWHDGLHEAYIFTKTSGNMNNGRWETGYAIAVWKGKPNNERWREGVERMRKRMSA